MEALDEIQEQVNLMYASAKFGEDVHGQNVTSIRLRQFADNIGALLARSRAAIYRVNCGCCGPWIRNENGRVSEFPTEEAALKGETN